MKQLLLAGCFIPFATLTQVSVTYDINTSAGTHPISPYIYGMCNGGFDNATIRRQGGNRMTGYNWENNDSNAGSDYFHQNDDYLPWSLGVPLTDYDVPGIVTTTFHDSTQAHNALTAVTLQMAGYVAKDANGTTVETWEAAPSNRWAQIVNHKPTAFSLAPDAGDGSVYIDEYLNYLIAQYGNAGTSTGIKAYILDNEPGLWTSTHPRLYTGPISAVDHLSKSIALAKTVREMDAQALILGPESYGYNEYRTFQDASDWPAYSTQYSHYLAAYLDSMRQASAQTGSRLLDVMTVHWYPDVNTDGIFSASVAPDVVRERMQLPRSLWDSTYVEDGWIGEWFSQDLPILPKLKSLIATYYPGTQLGVTEYDYGGDAHISGGIAEVEALGGFARTETEYATKWGAFSDYSLSAVKLYRDVAQPFGDTYIHSNSSDRRISSIFGSIPNNDDSELHLVVTNKIDSTVNAQFNIASTESYDSVRVYYFTQGSPAIQTIDLPVSVLQSNGFSYALQPLTAYHFVLKTAESTSGIAENTMQILGCFPNPAREQLNVELSPQKAKNTLFVVDMLGYQLLKLNIAPKTQSLSIDLQPLAPGPYFLQSGNAQILFVKE